MSHLSHTASPLILFLAATVSAARAADVAGQTDLLGPLPPPGLYGRLVDPSEYPAYRRRGFLVPTWATFDNRPQLVGGRYQPFDTDLAVGKLDELPDPDAALGGRDWFVGKVFRPNIAILGVPEPRFSDTLRHMDAVGMFLFNVGGYGPGSPLKGGFGQCYVTEGQKEALEGIFGDAWLGFDLGEQDGRYHNGFAGRQLPSPRGRVGQHRMFRDWCDRVIDDQGGRISLLTTLWGWHYPVQDGAMTLIGAECENKFGMTAPQVQYAFLRGAGKQYGVLWYGDQSIFSTFGLSYWQLDDAGKLVSHPGGASGNLLRRIFLTEWLWNSCILGFEGATVATDAKREVGHVSPIGRVQLAVEKLIRQGFTPGVMQTPVAILQDYFSGWMPARTNCTQFTSFNALPYRPGDYFTDNLLAMVYPGYENCGWFFDERGAMCPTPYGDIADCLLNDAPAQVLSRYSLVLCSGLETDVEGTRNRLDTFLATGGIVMAAGDDAARLWPQYCRKETIAVPAGTPVQWPGAADTEPWDFALHEAKLPDSADVLATCQGRPAVARIPHGQGTLIIAFAATGMNQTALPAEPGRHPMWGGENTELERPFRLLTHVRRACDTALQAQRLFSAGTGLTVTSCRREDGSWVVGVSNPGLTSRPFALTSHVGPVASLKEIDLGSHIHEMPGYWPHRWGRYVQDKQTGKWSRDDLGELTGELVPSDATHIRGGDIRFFEVALESCAARPRPDLELPAPPHDRLLRVPDLVTLRERLLAWPRFAYCFDGVALDAGAILDVDPEWLREHAGWFRRHAIRILIDARGQEEAVAERVATFGDGVEMLAEPASEAPEGLTRRTPDQVRFLTARTTPERGTGRIQVLEGDWRSWEGIYRDVRAAWLDDESGRITGPGAPPELPVAKAAPGTNRWISLHGIADPAQSVAERPGLLERFDGLVLDSTWLEARSREALARHQAFFEKAGLSVAIDFTRSLSNFPGLTFSTTVPHRYEASRRILDSVLAKMPALGATRAIICSHVSEITKDWLGPVGTGSGSDQAGKDKDDQLVGIERFLDKAAALGVTVAWRTSTVRPPGKLSGHAAWVATLRERHPNLRIAACTADETDPDKLLKALAAAGTPELWLLAAPSPRQGRPGVQFLPLTSLSKDTVKTILAAASDATVVFDADYLSWNEVLTDLDYCR